MNARARRTLTTTARLLGLALGTWAAAAHAADVPPGRLLQDRQQRIARMSDAERQRLAANLEAYKKLPEPRRQQLRQLYLDLEADARSGGGLQEVMRRYGAWLQTLNVGQREKLRTEQDPLRRQVLVANIRAEQREKQQLGFVASRRPEGEPPPDFPTEGGPRYDARLNINDLAAVMQAVERRLVEEGRISPEKREQLQPLIGFRRYRALLQIAGEERGGRPFLDGRTLDDLVASISDPDLRRKLSGGPHRRPMFIALLGRSLMDQVRHEVETQQPGGMTAEALKGELSAEQRKEIERLPPDLQRRRVANVVMEDLFQAFKKIGGGDLGRPRGPGGKGPPPGERPPHGDRPPPGDRPPGDRPPPGERRPPPPPPENF